MELVLYTIIAWLVTSFLITNIQKSEVVRSIIIYFFFTMLIVSTFTIISLNLKLINLTKDKTKFLSLLINRNIIMPFLILIFINFFYKLNTHKKIISIILLMLSITLLEFINLKLQLYSYVKWNFGLTFLINIFFILIILIISKWINFIQMRSEP